jgi:hypothetical protein
MTATNKWLLISESHGDSNRCAPCRGKPDQHTTRLPHSVCVWSKIIRISHDQHIATLRETPTSLDRVTAPEKRAPDTIHSTSVDRSTGLYPVSLPSQPIKQWRKSNICRRQATRLTGLISPACDRYIQHLLAGVNPLILNWHRWGLQP